MRDQELISRSTDVLGGTPVFAGTRVPIRTFIDYLEDGQTVDDFLSDFPSVNRDQVISLLEMTKATLTEPHDASAA